MDLRQFVNDRRKEIEAEDEKKERKSVNRWCAPEHRRIAISMERDSKGNLLLKWRGLWDKPVGVKQKETK
jgi:hypothetical protein